MIVFNQHILIHSHIYIYMTLLETHSQQQFLMVRELTQHQELTLILHHHLVEASEEASAAEEVASAADTSVAAASEAAEPRQDGKNHRTFY